MKIPYDLFQKLNILKPSSGLLLPILIGLGGMVLFIPTQLMSSKLRKHIQEESIQKRARNIESLARNAVPREQYRLEQQRMKVYADDANHIALLARQSTQRELLSYKIFPQPKGTSQFIFQDFGQHFCQRIDKLVAGLNATDCPTETELQRALESSPQRSPTGRYSPLSFSRRLNVPTRTFTMPYGWWDSVKATIIDEICREKAESASVYANPADLSGYEYWKNYRYSAGMEKATEECWYYQLAYWVIEDVLNTVEAMNARAGSNSILTSPVKRLMSVNFDIGKMKRRRTSSVFERLKMQRTSRDQRQVVNDKPGYLLSPKDAVIDTCTGRYCDDDIDVIHFNVVVVVSSKAVLPFMQTLCSAKEHKFAGYFGDQPVQTFKHNQITILESKIRSIDPQDENHRLYRYGGDAVVELDLICEYVFNRAGYEEIKPPSIKEAQKVAEQPEKK